MNDIRMPLGLAILLIIILFIIGQWQLALLNIALLIIQLIACIFFEADPKVTIMTLAIIGLAIWIILCFIGVCEFPRQNSKNIVNMQSENKDEKINYCEGGHTVTCNQGYTCSGGQIMSCMGGISMSCPGGNWASGTSCIHGMTIPHAYKTPCQHGQIIPHSYTNQCIHGFTYVHNQPCAHGFTYTHNYIEECVHGYEKAHTY